MQSPLESLRAQLQMHVDFRNLSKPLDWRYPFLCIEDLVLRHGRVFTRSTAQPPIERVPKACFSASYRLATRSRSRWIYCEGYGVTPNGLGIAVQHAWIINPENPDEAVDLAWQEATPDDTAYMGIAFRPEFVRDTFISSKRSCFSVLDTWWDDYPLITGRVKLDDVIWKPSLSPRIRNASKQQTIKIRKGHKIY